MKDHARILVVEDDIFYRQYLVELLRSRGMIVDELGEGQLVYPFVATTKPDLVILDLFMSDRDGFAITTDLKNDPATLHIPIIILTGSVEHSDIIRCLELGADDFISKNCKGYELFLRINAHLRAKRLYDQLRGERDRVNTILEVTRTAASSLDQKKILDEICLKLQRSLRLAHCQLVQFSADSEEMLVLSTTVDERVFEQPLDLREYPEIADAIGTRRAVVYNHVWDDPQLATLFAARTEDNTWDAVAVVPIFSGGKLLGVLHIQANRGKEGFLDEEIKICEGIADSAGNVLKNAALYLTVLNKKNTLEQAYQQKYHELEETNRQLAEAIRLKDDFLSICSHDIKSPLHILIGHANLLLGGRMGDLADLQTKSIAAIKRQGTRVTKLVDDLLDLRKIEEENIEVNRVPGDVNRHLIEWCENQESAAQERNIALRCEAAPTAPGVNTDWVLLRQLIENLLLNAIKFSDRGATITTRIEEAENIVSISVIDEGIGIEPADIERVFEKFYTTRRPGISRGSGLGLAIVRRITDILGGTLTVESTPGVGSKFTLHLPKSKIAAPWPLLTTHSDQRSSERDYKILTIDDEADARDLLRLLLHDKFSLAFAEDGMQGVIAAREFRPDLILMDLNMPRLNGLEATRRLKSHPMTRSIPIIIVSSTRNQEQKLECFSAGADDFIQKPFEPAELNARINVHLRG